MELLVILSSTFILMRNVHGNVTLSPCVDNYFEVKEGKKTNMLTCQGLTYQDTVLWHFWNSTGDRIFSAVCPLLNASCTAAIDPLTGTFRASRTSYTESFLYVDPVVHGSSLVENGGQLQCQRNSPYISSYTCQMDYVYPAEVGACSVQFNRWSVTGQCDVTKAFSARGRYSCQGFIKTGSSEIALDQLNMMTSPQEGKYVNATCALSTPLPTVAGSYSYRVVITPGSVHKIANITSSNVIEVPQTPTLSCSPSGHVPENTYINCTCYTTSVGQPAGRLKFVWGTAGSIINNIINTGNYGDKTLGMEPQRLQREDDGRQFRCDVEWASNHTGQVHTARVGYAASHVSLSVNSASQTTTVSEGQDVTYTCSSSGGQPAPNVTLVSEATDTQLAAGSSSLTHTQRSVQCEDGGQYSCTADNGMGQPLAASATLFVNCAPRRFGTELPGLTLTSTPTSVHFHVTAFPVPEKFTFAFLGHSEVNITNITTPNPNIKFTGSCREGDKVYLTRCKVTVVDMVPSAAGLYEVTLDNGQGKGVFFMQIRFGDEGDNYSFFGVAVGVSAVLVVMVMAFIVIVVVVLRRRLTLARPVESPQTGSGSEISSRENEDAMSTGQLSDEEAATTYETLRMSDVGLTSDYSSFNSEEESACSTEDGAVYQNIKIKNQIDC